MELDQVINEASKVSDAIAKKSWNHLDTSTYGACAIDAVAFLILIKLTKYVWLQMLFCLEQSVTKIR
jgi:hypothetical protein